MLLLLRWGRMMLGARRYGCGCGRVYGRGREGELAAFRLRCGRILRIGMGARARHRMLVLVRLMMLLLWLVLLMIMLMLLLVLLARAGRRIVQPVLRERVLQPRHAERAWCARPVAVTVTVAAFALTFAFVFAFAFAFVDGGTGGNGCARASASACGAGILGLLLLGVSKGPRRGRGCPCRRRS